MPSSIETDDDSKNESSISAARSRRGRLNRPGSGHDVSDIISRTYEAEGRGVATFTDIASELERQAIELPSWAFGNSGTRFKVFAQAGVPRDPYEKIADAAQVHKYTGVAPSVALHIPWDKVDSYPALATAAAEVGITL